MICLAFLGMVTCGGVVGCSGNGVQTVDVAGAKQALNATLESWKKGVPIDSLRAHKPSIVAQDMDWEAGVELIKFDVLGEGRDEAVNLRIPVDLTLRDKAGKEVKKKVKYMVGTSPVITVFREIF